VLDTMRMHRIAATAWVFGGGLATFLMGAAIAKEMAEFAGGPKALERSMMPSARAFRPMRWPAEHLDTLGGYITYHNMLLICFFLTIYGAIQGTKAIRGAEEGGSLEYILTTGTSRSSMVLWRMVGFAVIAVVIGVGLAAGLSAALASNDESNISGSLITCLAESVSMITGYAFGLLVSQFTMRARVAAGICGLVLTALQVITNLWDELGPLGLLRFISPFHYANASRALVPGHGLDLPAILVSLALAGALAGIGALVLERRDYGAGMLRRRERRIRPMSRLAKTMLGGLTSAQVARARVGLIAWGLGASFYAGAMIWLQPGVMKLWASMSFLGSLGGGTGAEGERLYQAFVGELISPVIAGYVVTQAAAWVGDRAAGRVEAVLSLPVTWLRLTLSRVASTLIGIVAIVAACMAIMEFFAVRVQVHLDGAGLVRLSLSLALFGAALTGIAVLAVALVPSAFAVLTMSLYLGATYMLTLLVPILGWPDWLNRASIFWALGRPYLAWPTSTGFAVLAVLAVGAPVVTVRLLGRRAVVA